VEFEPTRIYRTEDARDFLRHEGAGNDMTASGRLSTLMAAVPSRGAKLVSKMAGPPRTIPG